MSSRFRVFLTEINLKLERIKTVVLSCCVLHYFLRRSCNWYAADVQDESEEEQSDILTPLQHGHNKHSGEEGRAVREKILRYFNEEGKVQDYLLSGEVLHYAHNSVISNHFSVYTLFCKWCNCKLH